MSCHAGVRVCVSLLLGAAVLVANAWLLLGGDCLSLWFQGLGRGWLLLEDACECLQPCRPRHSLLGSSDKHAHTEFIGRHHRHGMSL